MLKRFSIWIDKKTLASLKAIGKQKERPVGWIMRKAIEEFVAGAKKGRPAVNKIGIAAALVASLAGCAHPVTSSPERPVFTIIEHHIVPAKGLDMERQEYTVRHGNEILKVLYSDSQTSSAKPGDFPGTGLHYHNYSFSKDGATDLSQIPEVGVPILQCMLSEEKMSMAARL